MAPPPWSAATARWTGSACPRFDSPACFAALLGDEDNGRWLLAPADEYEVTRSYVGDTALLETTFTTADRHRHDPRRDADQRRPRGPGAPADGRARHGPDAARVGGPPRLREDPPLGEPTPRRREDGEEAIVAVAGPDKLVLRGPRLPRAVDGRHVDEFDVTEGEVLTFATTWVPSWAAVPAARRPGRGHREHPRRGGGLEPWVPGRRPAPRPGRAQPADPAAAHPRARPAASSRRRPPRCPRTSAACATGTTATPGCATPSLTVEALLTAGFTDEASLWRSWLLRAVAGDPEDLQIMYAVDGARRLPEHELDHLAGYADSAPVRIGNAAVDQRQTDVLGEVMIAFEQARRAGRRARPATAGRCNAPSSTTSRPTGTARQRAVGDPGPAAALHPLAGDGLGGVRPRGPGGRGARPGRTGGPLAAGP